MQASITGGPARSSCSAAASGVASTVEWPGLEPAAIDGNALRVTVDYRSILADILEYRLGSTSIATVLPGYVDTPEKRLGLAIPLADPDPASTAPVVDRLAVDPPLPAP